MKLSNHFILSTSPLSQPAKNPRKTANLTRRQRLLYGRKQCNPTVKERDLETGLYYYGARYLDSKTSRWLSGDPAMGEYVPEAPVDDKARKRNGNLPGMGGVFNYVNLHVYHYAGNNPVKYVDPDGREPTKPLVGTSSMFKALLNNSPRQVGKLKGEQASNYLLSLGNTEFKFSQMRPSPTETGYFNKREGRYIYTEKGGWVDMVHFLFYAGKAYQYKMAGEKDPVGKAIQYGYWQEESDNYTSPHSAYSYEDLPSDRFGAEFGANFFNKDSRLTFGEQVESFLKNILKATSPQNAPNYEQLPVLDPDIPTRTNLFTVPVFTEDNP
jgi:RHS repeat-associated protein